MIWSGITFFNEFELLKLRCEELRPLGVTHILVESDHTHQGKPKPLYFEQQKGLFREYNIVHKVFKASPEFGPWANERAQRDLIWDDAIKDDDILLVTDADEIPRANAIKDWSGDCAALQMRGCRYFLNRKPHAGWWEHGRIMTGKYARGKSLSEIRNAGVETKVPDAGWHFSWMGGLDRIAEKLENFAHKELNTAFYREGEYWAQEMAAQPFLKLDASYPRYLVEHPEEFSSMIHDPTPMNAAVLYPVPCESPETWRLFRSYVERFCATWRKYPPGATVELVVICAKKYPTDEILRLFEGLPANFVRYDGDGADLGAHQWYAKNCAGNPFLICCTSRMYFHREGWGDRLLQARDEHGPGLYGISASNEGGKLHVCTRGHCLDAEDLRDYPVEIESRDKGVYFECGEGCLLTWMEQRGKKAWTVYWDGVWEKKEWFERLNIFRRGDQSNMLMWDKHTDIWARADATERSRLEAMAFCQTKQLTTVSRSGVGDRIRLMLNGYRLAQKLGREHVHVWEVSEHCGADFEELFWTNKIKVVAKGYRTAGAIVMEEMRRPWAETTAELEGSFLDPHIILDSFCEDCDLEGFGLPLITFSAAIWDHAMAFWQQAGMDSNTIGVHVRGRDYSDKMLALREYMDAADKVWRSGGPSSLVPQVFLATDEPIVKEEFGKHLHDRVITLPGVSYDRGGRLATIESVIELCLLRMCRCQVLSAYSGFSMMAIKDGETKRGKGIRVIT